MARQATHENRPRPLFRTVEGLIAPGVRRVINVGSPAVGTDFTLTVPGGRAWRLLSSLWVFAASATVASRYVGWQDSVGGVMVELSRSGTAIIASQTLDVCIGALGVPSQGSAAAGIVSMAHPNYPLPAGATMGSNTLNIQATDQLSAVNVWIEELYETEQDMLLHAQALESEAEAALNINPSAT